VGALIVAFFATVAAVLTNLATIHDTVQRLWVSDYGELLMRDLQIDAERGSVLIWPPDGNLTLLPAFETFRTESPKTSGVRQGGGYLLNLLRLL